MALVNSLLTTFSKAIAVAETLYSVEKTKVAAVQAEANDLFLSAYEQFQLLDRNVNSVRVRNQEHSELTVRAAEAAFATKNTSIARKIVEEYLLKSPQHDQFYCRAKITLGLLIDSEATSTYGEMSIRQRKLALAELIIALDIATTADNKARYEFIVFNVSVECWRIVRQFLRSNRAKFFTEEILKVATALESVHGVDKNWLITFYSGASFCLQDAENGKTASEVLDKAITLAEESVAGVVNEEKVKYTESQAIAKEIDDLHRAIHFAEEKEEAAAAKALRLERGEEVEDSSPRGGEIDHSVEELNMKMPPLQIKAAQLKDEVKALQEKKQPLVERVTRLYMQRIHSLPSDGKRFASTPEVARSVRTKCLGMLHCMQANCTPANEWEQTLRTILAEIEAAPPSQQCAETLFDASRIARSLGGSKNGGVLKELSRTFARKGQDMVRSENILTAVLLVKQDLCTALQMVDDSNDTSVGSPGGFGEGNEGSVLSRPLMTESQTAGFAVNNRIEALKLLERVLSVSQNRVKDASLVQEVCVETWNALYPLIQSHLRKRVHRPIQLISSALADIDSPLLQLRAQIYYELSKCEEEIDYVVKANTEACSGLALDYGSLKNVTDYLHKPTAAAVPAGKAPAKGAEPPPPVSTTLLDPMPLRKDNPGYDSDRPLDVYLSPLADVLSLRSSVYSTPDTVEDQVISNLQQIRESSSKKYKKEMLSKSSQMMFEVLKDESENHLFQKAEELIQSGGLVGEPPSTTSISRRSSIDIKVSQSAPVSLEAIDIVLNGIRPNTEVESSSGRKYQDLLKLTQHRINIMTAIAQYGHVSQAEIYRAGGGGMGGYSSRKDGEYKLELSEIVEKSLLYVLSHSWKPRDVMVEKLIIGQVNACCMLAESIINRMDALTVQDDDFIIVPPQNPPGVDTVGVAVIRDDEAPPVGSVIVDPRAMGIKGKFSEGRASTISGAGNAPEVTTGEENASTRDMMKIKRMVLKLLDRALFLATEALDIVAVQNVIIYFWNINIHVFRKNLYHMIMPECTHFLERAVKSLQLVSAESDRRIIASGKGGTEAGLHPLVDRKLQVSIIEAFVLALVASGDIPKAIEVAMTGCTSGGPEAPNNPSVYTRRRLCELVSQLSVAAGGVGVAPAKGKKDAKGGGAVSADAPIPQFDHPILNVIGLLVVMEIYGSPVNANDPAKTGAIPSLAQKATDIMKRDVAVAMEDLKGRVNSEGKRIPLTQEENDEYQELVVSCWARLTRANLKTGNIYATNETAGECMQILSNGIANPVPRDDASHNSLASNEISTRVHKRVWRWASLCERFVGISISQIIRAEGQEKELQNQLRLASLRHFSLSCQFGQNAEVDGLILSSAIDAWNVSMALVDDVCAARKGTKSAVHSSLITLQKQIISALLFCKVEEPNDEEEEEEAKADLDSGDDKVSIVKLKLYLSVIEEYSVSEEWKQAMQVVMEAFDNVPSRMHKPLWKWRVVVMSKLGKSVLDGMQKLKENDPTLQARVYAILARSASKKRQQLEAYRKTIEILRDDISRVEYLLETAQWMGAVGLPRSAAMEVILGAVDALYEVEEQCLEEKDEVKDGMSESSRATTRTAKSASSRASTAKSKAGAGSRRGSTLLKRSASRGSIKSEKSEYVVDNSRLNIKQLDQALRAIVMASMLEKSSEAKLERCVEGIFFLDRAINLWQNEVSKKVSELVRKYDSESGSSSGQSASASGSKMSQEQISKMVQDCKIPSDAVDLAIWKPSKEFQFVMDRVTERSPLFVPSKASLLSLQLTVYYLLIMADILEKNGYTKSALMCIGWIRLCIIFGGSMDNPEPLLALLHFKTLAILSKNNALLRPSNQQEGADESKVPLIDFSTYLGNLELMSSDYITSIIPVLPDPESIAHSSDMSVVDFDEESMGGVGSHKSTGTENTLERRRTSRSRGNSARPSTSKGNPYNINTWTQEMTSNVDSVLCYVELCRCMMDMGLHGKARRFAKFVVMESKTACNTRAYALASTMLAEIDLTLGKSRDAVNTIVESRASLELTGDVELVAKQTVVLIKSYCIAYNSSEAARVAKQALSVLLGAAIIPLQTASSGNGSGPEMTSKSLLETAAAANAAGGIGMGKSIMTSGFDPSLTVSEVGISKEGSTQVISATLAAVPNSAMNTVNVEYSYEAAEGYLQVAFAYVDNVVIPERIASMKQTPKKAKLSDTKMGTLDYDTPFGQVPCFDMSPIDSVFSYCDTLASLVDGPRSHLIAQVLHKFATVSFTILKIFHTNHSKAGGDRDVYMMWIDESLSIVADRLERALDIYTGLLSRVPTHERFYVSRAGSTRVEFASSLGRKISQIELDLCEVLLYLNLLRSVFIPPPVIGDPSGKLSVIEKYLEQCRPTTATKAKLDIKSFKSSAIDKTLLLATSVSQWLNATNEAKEAALIFTATNLASRIEAGEAESSLCVSWHRKLILEDGDESKQSDCAVVGDDMSPTLSSGRSQRDANRLDDITTMKSLEQLLWSALAETKGVRYTKGLKFGSFYLMESSGKSNPAVTASFLMAYQSISAREWLLELWRSVMSPTSEVAASLLRVDSLLSLNISQDAKIQQRLVAEYNFLNQASPIWSRLNIQHMPKSVMENSYFKESTCILSLQFCPIKRTLYAAAGFPKRGAPESANNDLHSDYAVPGMWYVDKMFLDENNRRSFQIIVQQHLAWVDQTTKLVTTYGEGMEDSMDFEDDPWITSSRITEAQRTMIRAEHAVEEEFRALVEALSDLLSPLLGENSEIGRFIEAQLGSAFAGANLVLLMGSEDLNRLPFEAIPIAERFNGNVTRDFSASILGNRLHITQESKGRIGINASSVICMVDPYGDDPDIYQEVVLSARGKDEGLLSNTEDGAKDEAAVAALARKGNARRCITNTVNFIQKEGSVGGEKWAHVSPPQRRGGGVSVQDWIAASTSPKVTVAAPTGKPEKGAPPPPPPSSTYARALFAYAPGKIVGTLISPRELANLKMTDVGVVVLADQTHTDASYRRQLTVDSRKVPEEIALENPLIASALFSLAGAGCVISNHWCTTGTALERFCTEFWKEFTSGSKSAVEAVSAGRNAFLQSPVTLADQVGGDDDSSPKEAPKRKLRRWGRYAKVVYGVGNVFYNGLA